MALQRREFLKLGGAAALASAAAPRAQATLTPGSSTGAQGAVDYTLRIATGLVELSPEHIVSTTLYNGQFPGPLLRFKEGQRVVVDIYNDTDTPELVHWHGQMIPSDVDGAAEEGTPFVPAHGMRRDHLRAEARRAFASITRTSRAGGDLNRGTYTGQAGRSTSSRRTIPALTTARSSWCSRNSRPPSAAAATWPWMPAPALRSGSCSRWEPRRTRRRKAEDQGLRGRLRALRDQRPHARTRRAHPGEAGRARARSTSSTPARPRSAASPCPATSSGSWRSTATRSRRPPTCRCCGWARPSASPRSSR